MTETIYTPPSHIILTLEFDKKLVVPVNIALFKENSDGTYVYFCDKVMFVKETIDEIITMLNKPYLSAKADYERFLSQPI